MLVIKNHRPQDVHPGQFDFFSEPSAHMPEQGSGASTARFGDVVAKSELKAIC